VGLASLITVDLFDVVTCFLALVGEGHFCTLTEFRASTSREAERKKFNNTKSCASRDFFPKPAVPRLSQVVDLLQQQQPLHRKMHFGAFVLACDGVSQATAGQSRGNLDAGGVDRRQSGPICTRSCEAVARAGARFEVGFRKRMSFVKCSQSFA
jgi:hypothetical protein